MADGSSCGIYGASMHIVRGQPPSPKPASPNTVLQEFRQAALKHTRGKTNEVVWDYASFVTPHV